MSQRVLTFTYNKKKYISKPYCFTAAVMIEEKMWARDENGQLKNVGKNKVCGDAVDYLFEGTEATADILEAAVREKMRMCKEIHDWYMSDLMGKNDESLPMKEQATEKAEN